MDVSTAFLHGKLTEEVCIKQPQGFIKDSEEHLVCRSIYGLKQSPRCWNHALDIRLREMGTLSDPCHTEGDIIFSLWQYTLTTLLFPSEVRMAEVKQKLCKTFQMKDLADHYIIFLV